MEELNHLFTDNAHIVIIAIMIIGIALYYNFLCMLVIIKNYNKIDVKCLRCLYHIGYFMSLGFIFTHTLETDHINIMMFVMSIPMCLHILKDYVALGSYIAVGNNIEQYKKIEKKIKQKKITFQKVLNLIDKI